MVVVYKNLPDVVLATKANIVQSVLRNGGTYRNAGEVLGVCGERARQIQLKYARLMRIAENDANHSDDLALLADLMLHGRFAMTDVVATEASD